MNVEKRKSRLGVNYVYKNMRAWYDFDAKCWIVEKCDRDGWNKDGSAKNGIETVDVCHFKYEAFEYMKTFAEEFEAARF